jgi:DNA-binding MarR family transcriptional regulator
MSGPTAAALAKAAQPESGVVKASPSQSQASDASPRANVSLWLRLLESHNLVLGEVRRKLAEATTMPRFDLLANLEREDGQTLAALSRRMLVTAGNLTGLVDRAERDGVVERRADPRDRRLSRVYLTPKGRELIVELLPKHADEIGALFEELDPSDKRELRRLLGKLRDSLAKKLIGGGNGKEST